MKAAPAIAAELGADREAETPLVLAGVFSERADLAVGVDASATQLVVGGEIDELQVVLELTDVDVGQGQAAVDPGHPALGDQHDARALAQSGGLIRGMPASFSAATRR